MSLVTTTRHGIPTHVHLPNLAWHSSSVNSNQQQHIIFKSLL